MGESFIFGLLDGFRAGQVRHMCGKACWMVGWVKKNGTVFFFWPVGWISDWPGLIYVWKEFYIWPVGCIQSWSSQIYVWKCLLDGWMGKKNGTGFFFGLLDGFQTGQV